MEDLITGLLICVLVALVAMVIVGLAILKHMKKGMALIRSKFDKGFLRRFETLYSYAVEDKKIELVVGEDGKARKYIKNSAY